ncbi:MAG: PEP-CTERM sorting domain-containing protein [Pirellulales bacterium]|nr:PEP-CTERM sorting domain-containing protein [Pirellulales bacterium]
MKTTLKLVAVVVAAFGLSHAAQASQIFYCLNIDANGPGTWTLSAWTDAPAGLASYVVNLTGVASGKSSQPKGLDVEGEFGTGFTLGGLALASPNWQAFGGQNTTDAASVVYGVGNQVLGPDAFGGSISSRDQNNVKLTEISVPALLYWGTYDPSGASPGFNPYNAGTGAVFNSTDGIQASVPDEIHFGCLPEPASLLLVGLSIPALAYAIRRRKAA